MPSSLFANDYHAETNKIRKDHKNILNRLRSISEDAGFVREIASVFPKLPLVANERCGSWYIDPTNHKVHSVYFKSMDGHMGRWDFNLRRSNLHLLDVIREHGGCIIVDSTRKGKRIPDALSKTIPIWCSTLNRAVAKHRKKDSEEFDASFYSLPSVVSRSEHAQIEARIDGFAQRLLDSKAIDMELIANLLQKPLRPIWLTPQSTLLINDPPDYSDVPFWPVICLSASQAVESGSQARPGYLYVQGSGDDQEAWCMGLTPRIFWQHHDELVNASSTAECEGRVRQLVKEEKENVEAAPENDPAAPPLFKFIDGTTVAIGSRLSGKPPACWVHFDVVVNCTQLEFEENKNEAYKHRYLQLPIPEGKKGQHALYNSIPVVLDFVKPHLAQHRKVLVHCTKGQDVSVGIALAILLKYYNREHELCLDNEQQVDKPRVQHHLMKIISSHPRASPSRTTLKKINLYFMSKEDE